MIEKIDKILKETDKISLTDIIKVVGIIVVGIIISVGIMAFIFTIFISL